MFIEQLVVSLTLTVWTAVDDLYDDEVLLCVGRLKQKNINKNKYEKY